MQANGLQQKLLCLQLGYNLRVIQRGQLQLEMGQCVHKISNAINNNILLYRQMLD